MQVKTPMITEKSIDHKECGRLFHAARAKSGLTLREISEHLDLSLSTVWQYDRGYSRTRWTPELFQKAMTFIHSKNGGGGK
jgi:transposase